MDFGKFGHLPVDPEKVSFPEILSVASQGAHSTVQLCVGEMVFDSGLTEDEMEELGYENTILAVDLLPYLTLNEMKLSHLIPDEFSYLRDLSRREVDVGLNPDLRRRIYSKLKIDPNISYFDLSKSQGYDFGRFY